MKIKTKEIEKVGVKRESLGERERDVGYFRIQSRIRDKLGSDRSQHTSTLAVNSELCVAFLSRSDAAAPPPPPVFSLLSPTPPYLSRPPSLFFCAIVFTLKARSSASAGHSAGFNLTAVWITAFLKLPVQVILTVEVDKVLSVAAIFISKPCSPH